MILKMITFFLEKSSSMKEFSIILVIILLQNFNLKWSDARLRRVKK